MQINSHYYYYYKQYETFCAYIKKKKSDEKGEVVSPSYTTPDTLNRSPHLSSGMQEILHMLDATHHMTSCKHSECDFEDII